MRPDVGGNDGVARHHGAGDIHHVRGVELPGNLARVIGVDQSITMGCDLRFRPAGALSGIAADMIQRRTYIATSSMSDRYIWSVFGVLSMWTTGAFGVHGLISSTASNPVASIRSVPERKSHIS